MTLSAAQFDALSDSEAAFKLAACCGSSAWVAGMLARRPFGTRTQLLDSADEVSLTLTPADWLEAFTHHPRIGQDTPPMGVPVAAAEWSAAEQTASRDAASDVQDALAKANVEYEKRFGFIFIISASGRNAADILSALRERIDNAPDAEIFIAAREQQRITRLRLSRLLAADVKST